MEKHASSTPPTGLAGLRENLKFDLVSGFLVFLIALPLCLGIAQASEFPPIAGILTAIIGGLLTGLLSNSELTIKGPAAGMIVIVAGCVMEYSELYTNGDKFAAYRMALAVGVVSGIVQILFGLFRTGILGEFFPLSAVHGMLAAIGVIIAAKQIHIVLGHLNVAGEPAEQIVHIPHSVMHLNPEVACIGIVSLSILFGLPLIKHPLARRIPGPMVVLILAVAMGMYFDLAHEHNYQLFGHEYMLTPSLLVDEVSLWTAFVTPDFSHLLTATGLKYIVMFSLVGTLESLLSAKAIDLLDPWHRKTNLNSDLLAVGVANTATSFVGGLPMISEIVRSSANINNGARTRWANVFHGLFLLLFVLLAPALIHQIPKAALAAMLVYTGYRLASPQEFIKTYQIGVDQLAIFITTLVVTVATDLLIGIGAGIAVQLGIHMLNGCGVNGLFKPQLTVEDLDDETVVVRVNCSAIFTNWIFFKKKLETLGLANRKHVVLDMSGTHIVDNTVMEKLHEMELEFHYSGLRLEITGFEGHKPVSDHPHSTRRKARELAAS
jgi:MFS superfamily sulfate permease-like transporter